MEDSTKQVEKNDDSDSDDSSPKLARAPDLSEDEEDQIEVDKPITSENEAIKLKEEPMPMQLDNPEIAAAPTSTVKQEDNLIPKVEAILPKATTSIRAGSPEKKVINLSPIAISLFKNPTKSSSGAQPKAESSDGTGISGTSVQSKSESSTAAAPVQSQELRKMSFLALANALKKKVFCANTNCNVKTDTVIEAPSFARLYFGMSSSSSNTPKICSNCYKKAERFHLESKELVKNKQNLFDLTFEIQTASSDAVVDLDSPGNSPHGSDTEDAPEDTNDAEMYSISEIKLQEFLDQTLKKYDIKQQLENCTATVTNEVQDLSDQFLKLDLDLDLLRDKIDIATRLYNDNIAESSKVVEIGSVQIDARGAITVTKAENLSEVEGLSRIAMRQLNKAVEELQSVGNGHINGESNNSYYQTHQFPVVPQNPPRRLSKLIFVKPKEGQDVFGMHKHCLFYWLPAKILKISISDSPNRPTIYTVQFQEKIRPKAFDTDPSNFVKELTGKQLAFKKPTTITLPVGTRIIAKFKDLLNTDAEVDGMLYAGVVAEIPKILNKNRYLIFFDDGYAQYVLPSEVLPVVESSPDVWLDVHKSSQDFIHEYVTKFPDRHMIRAGIGASFNVELNGNWLPARICEVDSSLMKVQYMRKAEVSFEWIYRGSTRLSPLFSRFKRLDHKQQQVIAGASPTVTVARRHTYRSSNFSFEVNRDNADDENKRSGFDGINKVPAKQGQVIRAKNGQVISTVLESEGNMVKIQIPRDCPSPKPFVPHSCSTSCAYRYEEEKFRKVSPLAIPFYLGWARELSGKVIFYHTPCGVRCGSYDEVHAYITKTEVNIPIDFFSMEPSIDCLNEFEPLRKIEYLKDISYGKEWTPISCVNSLDHELPAYMEYVSERMLGKGVSIEKDDGFLICCDCEDDCQDKEKCACWKQTMSGLAVKIAKKEGADLPGFENRRLKQLIFSGIYECNRKCKCRSTCFNRVVQNKVKWPIQMFKTVAKGWGVRALHDMPQGSFICVYTGQLLTDACANECGIEVGDEYLAELDYIECNENEKEEYESDCTDIENEEPGTRSNARLERQNSDEREKQPQVLAKKSTIQKALKSTGGKRRQDDDAMSTTSSVSTISAHSVQSTTRPVARKSGSKNGTLSKKRDSASKMPSSSSTSEGMPPSPAPTEVILGDSDDDDDIQVYSSFSASALAKDKKNQPRLPLRQYFGEDEAVYIMDAKSMGNFGRYLNHSCDPNVFVQNLFVDTHDPRFPWVAFFTRKDVKAGTELTWDYNYEIGSVPGKTLYCYCLKEGCRGRLL